MIYAQDIINECNRLDDFSDIFISPRRIKEISEAFLADDPYVLSEAVKNRVNTKDNLRKLGIKDENAVNKIDAELSLAARMILGTIRKEGLNKPVFEKVSNMLQEATKNVMPFISVYDVRNSSKWKGLDQNNITRSWILVCYVACINTIVHSVTNALLGPVAGLVITCCICAPICEELCKQIAIRGGFAKEFAIILNTYETIYYLGMMKPATPSLIKRISVRLFPIAMHLTTTYIQYISTDKEILKKANIDEKDSEKSSAFGYICGVMIHATWNAVCILT